MDQQMQNFIGLSAVLTGFSTDRLAPALDPVDIKSEYLRVWGDKVSAGLSARILETYAGLRAAQPPLSDQAIGEAMLDPRQGSEFVMACRQLICLWYMGAWAKVFYDESTHQYSTNYSIVSSKAYSAALVWQVMQAHPMGDSNERYGYWSTPPAALNAYTGQTDTPSGEQP